MVSINSQEIFKNVGFIRINNLISSDDVNYLYNYTVTNKANGNLTDHQALNTPSFYNDPEMVKLHIKLLPKIEELTGLKLFKTYTYYRTYKKGDILRIHRDRPACEISVTINLGSESGSWNLWMLDYNENANDNNLNPGEGIIYRGCDLYHWRSINLNAENYSQVFLHYVDQDGPFALAKDDSPINNI